MWVTLSNDGAVAKISPDAPIETFTVGLQPVGIAFDGISVWVANVGSDTVSRIPINP